MVRTGISWLGMMSMMLVALCVFTPSVGHAQESSIGEASEGAEIAAEDSGDGEPALNTDPKKVVDDVVSKETAAGILPLVAAIALFVVPVIVGGWLARRLKMPDYGWKFALCLGTIAAAAVVVTSGEFKLGPDLSGGITLIYELDGEDLKVQKKTAVDVIDPMIERLVNRVDPSGTKEVTIRRYAEDQIEIIIPKAKPQEMALIERAITTSGRLEFRITASKLRRHEPIVKAAQAMKPGTNILSIDDENVARWLPFRADSPIGRNIEGSYIKRQVGNTEQVLVLLNDHLNITGDDLQQATIGNDPSRGPIVQFDMKPQGATKFAELTSTHLPNANGVAYNLGIILDNNVISAPGIQARIRNSGEITGMNDKAEVEFLVDLLNNGSLPAKLNKVPISKEQISPTLGASTVESGKLAILASLAAVVVFMLLYYRFAGFVACVALGANLLLILGAMVFISGAFTLPGLAGLVLTVGMSVDANVLIFERIREEQNRGAALRMAIRNGFARATQTIVDANITTLITAIVIYKIAPDSVKGFGVTLILGILMSMYTAIFVSRLIFDVADKLKWMKSLSMARIVGETKIDFLGKRGLAAVLSAIVIGIGIFGISGRGRDLLNIDFTGGSSVTMVLNDNSSMEFSEVKSLLDETSLKDKNLSLVQVGDKNTRYRVTSVEQDVDQVQLILTETFGEKLKRFHVDVENVAPVPGDDQANVPAGQGGWSMHFDLLNATPAASLMLLQADTAEETQAAETQAEETETIGPAPDDAASDDAASDDAASESEPDSPPEASPETEAGGTEASSEVPSESVDPIELGVVTDPFAGGTSAKIMFSGGESGEAEDGLSHDALVQLLRDILTEAGNEGATLEVTNPEYLKTPGTSRAFVEWDLKMALPESQAKKVLQSLADQTNAQAVFPLANKIGGRVAGRMTTDAISAIVISLIGIIAYIWFRFQRVIYGLAAVIALIHDVTVTLGVVALSSYLVSAVPGLASTLMIEKFQISLPLVAAVLTIIGYSLNDTIVVFDRIREVKGKSPNLTKEMINTSINQTLSRTLLTSLTTLLTVLILYIWGGDGIHGFAFALVIGVIVGTYSSIFIASPALLWMSQRTAGSEVTTGKAS